jgi:hypothetical protein
MAERLNGRINEWLQQTRFGGRMDLQSTLPNYSRCNHHTARRAIDSETPVLIREEWQRKRPDLFVKPAYDQSGLGW